MYAVVKDRYEWLNQGEEKQPVPERLGIRDVPGFIQLMGDPTSPHVRRFLEISPEDYH